MAERLQRWSAWTTLGIIVSGYISLVPPLSSVIDKYDSTPFGHVIISVVVVLCGVVIETLWLSSIAVSASDSSLSRAKRRMTVVLLVLTNFVGGFLHYFLVSRRKIR
jgi:hypothetical protein